MSLPRLTEVQKAPQRPRTRDQDARRRGVAAGYDRSAPSHPAGTDPAKLTALLQLERADTRGAQ